MVIGFEALASEIIIKGTIKDSWRLKPPINLGYLSKQKRSWFVEGTIWVAILLFRKGNLFKYMGFIFNCLEEHFFEASTKWLW